MIFLSSFKRVLIFVFFILSIITLQVKPLYAQESIPSTTQPEMQEAAVSKILEAKNIEVMGNTQPYQKLELIITKGSQKGRTVTVENGNVPVVSPQIYKPGETVILAYNKDIEGNDQFYITDYIRRPALIKLFLIFLVVTLVIARFKGLMSLLGMAVSFVVIFTFILPQISKGADPVTIAIAGSLAIIPATFYLSHGFSRKTSIAIIGTLIALIITGIMASVFIEAAKLTGFASEEAGFLQSARPGLVNIKGLILAGTIIGALGVLDDITIAQAGIVEQLKTTAEDLSFKELYGRAMRVGQDHIASMVNTLILVYTGAALPLLLLFIDNPRPFSEVINYEIIADEIVRTLVGSIGLVTAVPITTLLAAMYFRKIQSIDSQPQMRREDKRYFRVSSK